MKNPNQVFHTRWAWRDVALFKIKKNKLWIWKAYRRETGELIDWECGGRDKQTLTRLMERLKKWNVELYCADNWAAYPEAIPEDQLFQSNSQTICLEQNNGRQRHWFARFRRKSIVVSKTIEMVDLTMALYAKFHVNGSWKDILALVSWHSPWTYPRPKYHVKTKQSCQTEKSLSKGDFENLSGYWDHNGNAGYPGLLSLA